MHTDNFSCKEQVPLETLSEELQRYVTVLKGKLVEVVNEDYNDFVSLSTKLVNVDGAVTQMQKPLLVLKVQIPAWHNLGLSGDRQMPKTVAVLNAYIIITVIMLLSLAGHGALDCSACVFCTGQPVSCTRSRPSRTDCPQPGIAQEAAGSQSQSSFGANARYSTCHVQGRATVFLS